MIFLSRFWIDWKKDSQKTRMRKVLEKSWEIGVFRLIQLTKIAHHTAIIKRLRDEDNLIIKQRSEFTDNIHKSFYTLIKD